MKIIKRFNAFKKDENGQSLALVTLMLVVLMGFAALAVDVALLTNEKSRLQAAADAGALAGAIKLPDISKAEPEAKELVNINAGSGVNTTVTKISDRKLRVSVQRDVDHVFGKVLGFNKTNVPATAVAERHVEWDGFGLPFVNASSKYWEGTNPVIDLWKKQHGMDPGFFEVINKKDIYDKDGYPKVMWGDGVIVSSGNMTFYFDKYVNRYIGPGKTVFAFSMKQSVIESGVVRIGTYGVPSTYEYRAIDKRKQTQYKTLTNNDNILPTELVLLELRDVSSSGNGSNLILSGTLVNVYDLGKVPIDISPFGRSTSQLIE